MKTLNDGLRAELIKHWKDAGEHFRDQIVAREVFGLAVDPRYGKLVERKETGGIRIINLPDYVQRDNSRGPIIDKMKELGWHTEFHKLPRSTRCIARLTHKEADMMVETHPMPEADALRFGAWMALELEKAIAAKSEVDDVE